MFVYLQSFCSTNLLTPLYIDDGVILCKVRKTIQNYGEVKERSSNNYNDTKTLCVYRNKNVKKWLHLDKEKISY